MIKNIIFDFGDIFINLDKEIVYREIEKFGGDVNLSPEIIKLNNDLEVGAIKPQKFINRLAEIYPKATKNEITAIWNGILLDFPEYRLHFIEQLAEQNKYRLFLLSNTNAIHIPYVEKTMGKKRFNRFKNCFEKFYLSHEIRLRKPNEDIFEYVLNQNKLIANETFFIDDTKENISTAENMDIHCWHLQVGQEDVTDLLNKLPK